MQEIVYKIPGKNHGPKGKMYDWKPVNSEDEIKQAIKDGWFNTLVEAINEKEDDPKPVRARDNDGQYVGDNPATPDVNEAYVSNKPATREELEEKAKELNINFNMLISDKKLAKKIENKLKG